MLSCVDSVRAFNTLAHGTPPGCTGGGRLGRAPGPSMRARLGRVPAAPPCWGPAPHAPIMSAQVSHCKAFSQAMSFTCTKLHACFGSVCSAG